VSQIDLVLHEPQDSGLSTDLNHDLEHGDLILHATRIRLTHPQRRGRFYQHGWHSWSPARWIRLDHQARPDDPPPPLHPWHSDQAVGGEHHSYWVGAVEGADGNVLLLGALGFGRPQVTASPTDLQGRASHPVDWYLAHGAARDVFRQYAAHLSSRLGVRSDDPGTVWCTWYSLGLDISEEQVDDVLTQLVGWPIDVFLVDDGWSESIGDWHPNCHFPSGMADLASRIRATDRRPGLWVAPLIAHESSNLAQSHPDWLVRGDGGSPAEAGTNWGGPFFGLDTTHPAVRDHIAVLLRRVTQDWGWTYLKLDFLYGAAVPGLRHRDLDGEAAYRSGIELIRDVVGDDVHLNACGAPIVPSLGVFDSLRIGPDVRPIWDDYTSRGTRHAVSTSIARLWLADAIKPDPDVAYFGSADNLLGPNERRLMAALGHITGFRSTSDPPSALKPEEAHALKKFLSQRLRVTQRDCHAFDVGERTVDFSGPSFDHPKA